MQEVVIITGASRGIGREIAKRLAIKGLTVVANYNKSEKEAEELKKELEEKGFIIDIVKADVSKREDAKKLVKFALDKYGKIDILINNAGISEYKLFTDETDEDWDKIINTNLYSVFAMSQEVIPNMIHNKYVICVGSCWWFFRSNLFSIKSRSRWFNKSISKRTRPLKYKSEFYCTRYDIYKNEF